MKQIQLSLGACRKNSGLTANDVLSNLHHTPTWLSLVESGKRRIYADELFELMRLYGLMDLSFNQIFLPTDVSKRQLNRVKIQKEISAKRNSNRKRAK